VIPDLCAGLGLLAVGSGLGWWLHPGAGLAAVGLALFALGVKGAWR